MNRREALAALMALPATTRITRANVQPNDVIVLECDELLTPHVRDFLSAQLRTVWPEPQRIIVLDSRLKLKVVSAAESVP